MYAMLIEWSTNVLFATVNTMLIEWSMHVLYTMIYECSGKVQMQSTECVSKQ